MTKTTAVAGHHIVVDNGKWYDSDDHNDNPAAFTTKTIMITSIGREADMAVLKTGGSENDKGRQ